MDAATQRDALLEHRLAVAKGFPPLAPEYTLLDLLEVLVERWRTLLAAFVITLLIGLPTALSRPDVYAYTTSIEIGNRVAGDNTVPLESSEAVLAKLKESYVPLAVHALENSNAIGTGKFDVDARVPKSSQMVVLSSRGGMNDSAYRLLHTKVVEYLRADHDRMMSVIKKELELKAATAAREQAKLQDDAQMLERQLRRINTEQSLVSKEVSAVGELIASAGEQRERALREAKDEPRAMTLLMLTDEVRQNRVRLSQLERRGQVELPNEKDQLAKLLADKQRGAAEQTSRIENIRLQIQNLQETRVVAPAMRSPEPVGIGKSVVVMATVFAGLVFGILAVFGAHLYARVRSNLDRRAPEADVAKVGRLAAETKAAA